ncbi:LOW QUALITY PROTEIN: piggyBac transposable element-derived protein 2-like [Plodia interpunctella]|uniref:LOW QUALITY PROTEIN: piggyBac transposable element-derived protein 2-like n=1 Tax=Plodia interpunctella TaxID=58824 RepID=UPI002367586C|nr:LOW QUALITY PROTEIN: piggyBac transposable element-derived protein 2-like [Plodia interpunctella]
MGIVIMPSYKDYWSTSYRYAKITDIMSLKRFQRQQVRRFIHFIDNTQADLSDRYYKQRPLIDSIRNQCLSVEEENAFSIDKMVIPYKGKKAGSRRHMLYGGDDTFRGIHFTEEEESLGIGSKVVIALCKTEKKKASTIYFDNYFTSLELVYILRENYGLFSLGIVRQNRLKDAGNKMVSEKILKKKGRGSFSQVVCNENKISVVKWFDNKQVTLVSSYTDAYPLEKIKRCCKESKGRVDVTCPQIVKHYNRHMGGVDLADMLISLYRTGIKSHRWYMNFFSQLLDICINNAWLLRRRHNKMKHTVPLKDGLKKFRYEVYAGLLKRDRTAAVKQTESVSENKKTKKPVAE